MLENIDLDRLEKHWAVAAIPKNIRDNCFNEIETIVVEKAIGNQIESGVLIAEKANDLITRIASAYEMAAIENFESYFMNS